METPDSRVLTILRSNEKNASTQYNYLSYSNDDGLTSTEIKFNHDLISPICQVSALLCGPENNRILIHSGPNSKDTRHKMSIKVSEDNGATWSFSQEIFEGKSGYSDLVALNSTTIGCLFECGRYGYNHHIRFAQFEFDWITQNT